LSSADGGPRYMDGGPEFHLAHEYNFVPGILEPYELQILVLRQP